MAVPGLQYGVFSNQKSKFGSIMKGLKLEKVGTLFHGHLEYNTANLYIWNMAIW
jgi:hypothetical protein